MPTIGSEISPQPSPIATRKTAWLTQPTSAKIARNSSTSSRPYYNLESFTVSQNFGDHAVANAIMGYDYGRVKGRTSIRLALSLINGQIKITSYEEKLLK